MPACHIFSFDECVMLHAVNDSFQPKLLLITKSSGRVAGYQVCPNGESRYAVMVPCLICCLEMCKERVVLSLNQCRTQIEHG